MRIIVVGAGIGGLTSAILLKEQGHEIEVYERDCKPRTIGAGLVLWPNATKLLESHNLLRRVLCTNYFLNKMCTYDHAGNILNTLDIIKLKYAMGNYPVVPIARKLLHQHLLKITSELSIKIHFNARLENIFIRQEKTVLRFSKTNEVSADLVIGADGRMSSITRKFVTGDNKPRYMGYINWVGLVASNPSLDLDYSIKDYWGIGERFGIVPISNNSFYWASCKVMQPDTLRDINDHKGYLLEIFDRWPNLILEAIKSTDDVCIKGIPVYDLEPCSIFYKDNVVLLGDSAHAAGPTSSQGACLAIEDAFCLADLLAGKDISLKDALEQYQCKRVSKTKKITEHTRRLTHQIFQTDPEACRQRNQNKKEASSTDVCTGMVELWMDGN